MSLRVDWEVATNKAQMVEMIRCLGGSVERIRRLRVSHGYNPEPGHRVNAALSDDEFRFEHLADYAYDFAAAQLTAADDHILALETLLLDGRRKVPPFVLGRAAIEAAGRAALFMNPQISARERAELVVSERIYELEALRDLIRANQSDEMPEAKEDLAIVELQIESLGMYAKQHGASSPERPSFRRALREALVRDDEDPGFGRHATALLSAIAHSVPDTLVAVSVSLSNPKWRPGHVGFLDVDEEILIDLVLAVLFAYFHAARRQIEAYEWSSDSWKSWTEHVRTLMTKVLEDSDLRMADRRLLRRPPAGPSETILGPDPVEPGPLTEKTLERWGVEAMEDAGIDPAFIHAFRKTGLLVAEMNLHLLSEEDIEEWRAAVEEYRELHEEDE